MLSTLRYFCLLALCVTATSAFSADSAGLTVAGKVAHPLKLDTIAVRGYPADQVVTLTLPGRNPGDRTSVVRGVRLKAFLDKAKLVVTDHNTPKKTAVIATARDGYAVVFSWSELFNSPAGDSVLVLFERDDKALPDAEGPLALIAGRDINLGPRHVKWLERIEVKQIVE
jgi:DMSO/TMAO reductase YedYZ molybdopterin-dependent catalytic subunit